MLIIEGQGSNRRRQVSDTEIEDVCLILAATDPYKPTDKERLRAAVYQDRIMKQGRTIQASGTRVWHVKEVVPTPAQQAEELFTPR